MMSQKPSVIQTTELLNRRWLSKSAFEIELSRPLIFEFKAGQTLLLIHKSLKRHYSLISTPNDPNFTLCIQHVPGGQFTSILAGADIGFQLQMTGPHGYFTFQPSNRMPVFISTGTGIAPFVCFARSGVTDFALFHQATSAEELYYQSYFHKIAPKCFSCLSETSATEPSLPNLFYGKISECVRKNLKKGRYDFYLCGEREMIRYITQLVDVFYPESRVYTEVFY